MSADTIHIEALELSTRIGAFAEERTRPQRLTVSITITPMRSFSAMSDALENTVDYHALARSVQALASEGERRLIETLAEEIAAHVLTQFPARAVDVELRKYILPDTACVAARLHRERSE